MKKIIVANWKTYINSEKDAEQLFAVANNAARDTFELVLCPPYPYLEDAMKNAKQFAVGAQNISHELKGAHTGEVTAEVLKDLGVKYAIIGHSERRAEGETDELINKKLAAALEAGLSPILCVGEPSKRGPALTGRGLTRNISWAKDFIQDQLKKNLDGFRNSKLEIRNLAIAYEPIWAISTGVPDKPEDTIVIVNFIKQFLASRFQILDSRVLYGGSVNSKNILDFLSHKEIDGALIGKASTDPEEFKKTLEAMKKITG